MKIIITKEELEKGLIEVEPVATDSILMEEVKNIVLFIKEGVLKLVATNIQTIVSTKVEADIQDYDGGTHYIQIRAKDILDPLSTYKNLKRTDVDWIKFDIDEASVVMTVKESAKDKESKNANMYDNETRFRLPRLRVKTITQKDVDRIEEAKECTKVVETKDVLGYLSSLLPSVVNEKKETFKSVLLGDNYIYTTLASYVCVMENKLAKDDITETFKGYRLQSNKVAFLVTFLNGCETFNIDKTVTGNGGVVITLRKEGTVAMMKCNNMDRVRTVDEEVEKLQDIATVTVDKVYLIEVLKRVAKLNTPMINIDLNVDEGYMKIKSENMVQDIPVLGVEGLEGVYKFVLKTELMPTLIFAHNVDLPDDLQIGIHRDSMNGGNAITMKCSDETGDWETIIKGLQIQDIRTDW